MVEIVTMSQDVLSQLTDSYGVNQESPSNEALVRHVADTPRNRTPSVSVVNRKADHNNNSDVQRVNKVSSGGCFGEADFFLSRAHR